MLCLQLQTVERGVWRRETGSVGHSTTKVGGRFVFFRSLLLKERICRISMVRFTDLGAVVSLHFRFPSLPLDGGESIGRHF
jgi:hypothetical protein